MTGRVCRTNLPSNTAMRGFGGPQGIAAIENVIEEIAAYVGIDPLLVRRQKLLRRHRAATSRPMVKSSRTNTLPLVIDALAESSDYSRRRDEAARFNESSRTGTCGGFRCCPSNSASRSPESR